MKTGLKFTQLSFVSAIDWLANNVIEVVYRLYSYETNDNAVIRVKLDRAKPEVDSVSGIYATADWHERETAEMFGIKYPIICGAMYLIGEPKLTAAVSNAGRMGNLTAGNYPN